MLKQRREKQQQMEIVIMEQMVPEDHFLRKVDRAVDFSFIYDLCAPLYCADNGRPAIDPEILFRMLFVGYLYGIKSEARLEEEVNYNIAYKWFCGLELTQKAPDATTIRQNRLAVRDGNIAEQIFNAKMRQCVEGLVGGGIAYGFDARIRLREQTGTKRSWWRLRSRRGISCRTGRAGGSGPGRTGEKPFERDDDAHRGGGRASRMSTTDLRRPAKPGETRRVLFTGGGQRHRTVDNKRNVIVNVHVEPANINDVTLPEILDEIRNRIGQAARYMGLDAGYHNAGIAHLLERGRGDTRGNRLPAAFYTQRRALQQVPLRLRRGPRQYICP